MGAARESVIGSHNARERLADPRSRRGLRPPRLGGPAEEQDFDGNPEGASVDVGVVRARTRGDLPQQARPWPVETAHWLIASFCLAEQEPGSSPLRSSAGRWPQGVNSTSKEGRRAARIHGADPVSTETCTTLRSVPEHYRATSWATGAAARPP